MKEHKKEKSETREECEQSVRKRRVKHDSSKECVGRVKIKNKRGSETSETQRGEE